MLRFEYDRVVAFHGYRRDQPWDMGGVRVLQVDGVNGPIEGSARTRELIRYLEQNLIEEAKLAGLVHTGFTGDNHYGFTVVSELATTGDLRVRNVYQIRFSDGSVYLWLMTDPTYYAPGVLWPETPR